jgi:YHS domain-containing protein
MTPPRQEFKERWLEFARIAALCGLLPGVFLWANPLARAATTERVVVDRFTGLAIGGVDPVAYFTDKQMRVGEADFELTAMGAVWRFCNADNRTFFQAAPQVYAPQFGGYDPVDVARGVAVAGVPRLWIVHAQRLYLFSREESRDAFAADPEQVLHSADAAWPRVRDALAE